MEKIVKSPITALFVTIYGLTIPYLRDELNAYLMYTLYAAVVLYLLSLTATIIIERRKRNEWVKQLKHNIIYEKTEYDWSISKDGDFFGRYLYQIKNISNGPIHALPIEDIGWHKLPDKPIQNTEIRNIGKTNYVLKESRGSFYETFFNWAGRKDRDHFITFWYDILYPALQPDDSILVIKDVQGEKTDNIVFTETGGLAGFPINVPTKEAVFSYRAPPQHRFKLIVEVLVFDSSGERRPKIEVFTPSPKLNEDASIITWRIEKPRINYRYNFRYKVEKK